MSGERPADRNASAVVGRFAPSPTGDLHLGNLRTAAVAWLSARSQGGGFIVRMEDLDQATADPIAARGQLADLSAIGLDWDGEVVFQSARFDLYDAALATLTEGELIYECYCSRRQVREQIAAAAAAPHGPPGAYPGTCRDLDHGQRADRRASGRPAALRLRADTETFAFDELTGDRHEGAVDDFVLRRNDGTPSYNLAVVVDDERQGVTEIVRGDDLRPSTPRQVLLQELLGFRSPVYLHVPLVLGDDGERLAKRHGAVTLADLRAEDVPIGAVLRWIALSLDLAAPTDTVTIEQLIDRFDPTTLPTTPHTFRHSHQQWQ
ncbi:MAG: tRNA glutamyl-Q(34) synthetase GluQRS [Actinomycetota bacterium]